MNVRFRLKPQPIPDARCGAPRIGPTFEDIFASYDDDNLVATDGVKNGRERRQTRYDFKIWLSIFLHERSWKTIGPYTVRGFFMK